GGPCPPFGMSGLFQNLQNHGNCIGWFALAGFVNGLSLHSSKTAWAEAHPTGVDEPSTSKIRWLPHNMVQIVAGETPAVQKNPLILHQGLVRLFPISKWLEEQETR
ncbi:MAG: hypothetical protein KAT56_04400, partial [Sedimentisphaerales bacterium]|nr:hypothetical protein [Sedimentisphaerales bacterium]